MISVGFIVEFLCAVAHVVWFVSFEPWMMLFRGVFSLTLKTSWEALPGFVWREGQALMSVGGKCHETGTGDFNTWCTRLSHRRGNATDPRSFMSLLTSIVSSDAVSLMRNVLPLFSTSPQILTTAWLHSGPVCTVLLWNHIYLTWFCKRIVINYRPPPPSFASLIRLCVVLWLLMFHSPEQGSTSFTTCH